MAALQFRHQAVTALPLIPAGRASEWSGPARFEIELDRTSGWHAAWIAPSPTRATATPPPGTGPVDEGGVCGLTVGGEVPARRGIRCIQARMLVTALTRRRS
jgi:hypothetical protein